MTSPSLPQSRTRIAPRYWSLGLSLACVIAGCGGEDKGRVSGRVTEVPPVDQCKLAEAYEFQNLVDFEPVGNSQFALCDPKLAMICNAPSPTPFYFNYDTKHTSPVPDAFKASTFCRSEEPYDSNLREGQVLGAPNKDGPRCGVSEHALQVLASNVAECYGANGRPGWGAALDLTMRNTLDAVGLEGGPYDGISFWVRKGSAATKPTFVFSVVDVPNNGIDAEFSGAELPQCGCRFEPTDQDPRHIQCYSDPPADVPDGRKCDAFSAAVTLTDEWTFIAARFSALTQKGFGAASLLPEVDATRIKRLQFLITAGDWDFWIDDLALFKDIP